MLSIACRPFGHQPRTGRNSDAVSNAALSTPVSSLSFLPIFIESFVVALPEQHHLAATRSPILIRMAEPSIAPTTYLKTGLQISDRLDGQRFDRLEINRQFGVRFVSSSGANCYTDIVATVDRLKQLNAARLLFIATG